MNAPVTLKKQNKTTNRRFYKSSDTCKVQSTVSVTQRHQRFSRSVITRRHWADQLCVHSSSATLLEMRLAGKLAWILAPSDLCVNFKDFSFLLRNILSDFWNRGKFFLFCSANVKTLHDFMKIMSLLLSLLEKCVTGKFYTCMMTHLNWNRAN